ncbi:predicted protein [Uncinocarpus reesii 1704]|uniref:Uncharacterized protein n=1 Tax=Uncinocarpus reesii (strain UAMH 1704) TaxID=336963 RepID=C4JJH3_UNCRE|nr:uncharacterized protein UREG_01780 [Uncinocarpus reesii 1704]EEP76931.1 predicted protein [Uncinocarpus reesii 1704]
MVLLFIGSCIARIPDATINRFKSANPTASTLKIQRDERKIVAKCGEFRLVKGLL